MSDKVDESTITAFCAGSLRTMGGHEKCIGRVLSPGRGWRNCLCPCHDPRSPANEPDGLPA